MTDTGILYRRNTKSQLISDPPVAGEIVFALDTEEYGAIELGTLLWRKHSTGDWDDIITRPEVTTTINGDASGISTDTLGDAVTLTLEVTKATTSFSVGPTTKTTTHSFVTGKHNIGQADTIVEVGIGIDTANKANALEIYTDGRIVAPSMTKAHVFTTKQALVTREYIDDLVIDCGIFTI